MMAHGRRRTGRAGGPARRSRSGRSTRFRLTLAGAVGAVGFAVFYFFDPVHGPRRRQEAYEWVHETALEAWERSQAVVAKLAGPVEVEDRQEHPPVPVDDSDLAKTLRDEVAFVTVRMDRPGETEASTADEPVTQVVPVAVGALSEQPGDRQTGSQQRSTGDEPTVSYVHPEATPPPTIIAYDATDEETAAERASEAPTAEAGSQGAVRSALVGAAVAAILLVGAGLGAWAVWGGDDDGTTAAAPTAGAAEAIELISQPGARSIPVKGSQGAMVLVVSPGGRAVLVVSGLAKAPPDKEYQAWVVTGRKPRSAGLFKGGETRLVIPLGVRVPKGAIVAVTVERAGGAPAPTQEPRYTLQLT